MSKRLTGGIAALLLLLAAVALSIYLAVRDIRRDIGPQIEQTAAAEPVTTHHSPAAEEEDAATAEQTVRFVTADGEPAGGVAFTLAGVSARSDADGIAIIEGPLGLNRLHFENNWVGNPDTVFIREDDRVESVTVYRTCPGRVRVLKDGEPASGRIRAPYGEASTLDAQGWAYMKDRICGRTRLTLTRSGEYQRFRGEILGDEDIILEFPEPGEAWLLVRDDEDQVPEGVSVHGGEREAPGRFHVAGRGESVQVRIALDGAEVSVIDLPLDGREHTAIVPGTREVEVHILCDVSCPETIRCAASECSGALPTFTCTCPRTLTAISASTTDAMFDWKVYTEALAAVPPGVDQLTIEIPDDRAALTAHWTGDPAVPCDFAEVWAEGALVASTYCDEQGWARFDNLPTGSLLVSLKPSLRGAASRQIDAGYAIVTIGADAAEEVDIAPGQGLREARVLSSEPLEGALLQLSPGPSVILDASGRFSVPSGAPVGVALTLSDGRRFSGLLEPGDRTWNLDDQVQTGWALD